MIQQYRRLILACALLVGLTAGGVPVSASQTDAPQMDASQAGPSEAKAALLQRLQSQARQQRLAARRGWQTLGHYQAGWLSTVSQVDEPGFFLAPDGKVDPEAELMATLDLLVQGGNAQIDRAQCRYPARYRWLQAQLDWTVQEIPEQSCPGYERWLRTLSPERLTLVFPAAYMNNPSSMFGHTLLRIDSRGQTRATDLVAFAVNYAAEVDPSDGSMLFALKGLVGSYPGYFSLMPYYRKVKEYSDLESRDMWEYELALSTSDIRRMLAHLWELQGVRFDYYFFDENCSYQLLALLESARPDLRLTEQFPLQAIPSDTVRVLDEAGLLQPAHYRPSYGAVLTHHSSELNRHERQLAQRLAADDLAVDSPLVTTLPPERQAAILEAAYEVLNFRFRDQRLPREATAPRLQALLLARSQVDAASPFSAPPQPAVSPEQGHGTARTAIAAGVEDQTGFLSWRIRPAYHSLLDKADGYVPGAQISFLDLEVRAWFDRNDGDVRLQPWALQVIDIVSLSPQSTFFSPWSWRLQTGFRRLPHPDVTAPDNWRYELDAAGGKAWGEAGRNLGYVLGGGALHAGPGVPEDEWALGPQLNLGWLYQVREGWRLHADSRVLGLVGGHDGLEWQIDVEQRWSVSRQQALWLSLGYQEDERDAWGRVSLGWHWYF